MFEAFEEAQGFSSQFILEDVNDDLRKFLAAAADYENKFRQHKLSLKLKKSKDKVKKIV